MKKMSQSINTVLIACGSFNPLTNLHLRMFESAKDHFNLNASSGHNVIKGIISPVSDKYESQKKLESSKHRCQMIRNSLIPLNNKENWIIVDEWESKQDRWFRTIEVLDHHYKQLNETADSEVSLKLLCGADLFDTFNVENLWRDEDIEKIVGKYGLVVIERIGYDPLKTLENSDKSSILLKHKENIHVVNQAIFNTISSTAIRNAIKKSESIRYLVPDPVVEYIEKHKLYK